MQQIKEPVQATNFRQHLNKYFIESGKEPVLVNSARSGSRVFLNLSKYNKLVATYEDYQDTQTLINKVENDSGEYISLSDFGK